MALPEFLTSAATAWSAYYSDHQLVSVAIRYLHIAGTVVGGGQALAVDRDLLAQFRHASDTRQSTLARLRGSHRIVVPALALVALTGLLMTAADLDTFLDSNLYRFKIAFVILLGINGGLLLAAETALARREGDAAWRRLALASGASMLLWLVTLFTGVWLTVAA